MLKARGSRGARGTAKAVAPPGNHESIPGAPRFLDGRAFFLKISLRSGRSNRRMYLIPFFVVEPELAPRETRVLYILSNTGELPAGSYGLLECYCPDPDCNCRRVLINVVEEQQPGRYLATISYAFDEDEMIGPLLDPLNPQSPYAEALVFQIRNFIFDDPKYVARLERHYHMVKDAASDPDHPAYPKLQQILAKARDDFSLPALRNDPVGRNDPCPCGSGEKYKHCCGKKRRSASS